MANLNGRDERPHVRDPPTPHPTSGPPGPAHTLGRGPRPQVRCLLPLTRPGRVDTSPGFWSCLEYPLCQARAPVASLLPSRLSMGREDVLPLPVSCRLCGGAGAHLHSAVRSTPAPPSPFSVPPRGGWRQVLIPPPRPPSPAPGISPVTLSATPSSAQNLPSLGVRHISADGSFKQEDRESFASGPRTVKQSSFLRNLEDGPIRQDAFSISPGAA